jgi:hypothetical protein
MEEFVQGNEFISYLMINFTEALNIIRRDGSIRSLLSPWQVPIVTGTEHDRKVGNRTRKDIREVLEHSQPAIYIPDAGEVYCNKPKDKQLDGLKEYRVRVDWLVSELEQQDWDIRLLPLAKAMEKWHCKEMLPWFRKHDFQDFAFYTRQYCNKGNHIILLVKHMSNFANIIEPKNMLAIARHGKNHLRKLPLQVNGASGLKQFLKHCNYDRGQFVMWRDDLEAYALNPNTFQRY